MSKPPAAEAGLFAWPWLFLTTGVLLLLSSSFLGILSLTQSRTGWAGMMVALLSLMFFSWPNVRWRWISLGIVIVTGIVVAAWWSQSGSPVVDHQVDLSAPETEALDSLDARLEIWSRAIYGIQDFPLTGMGMNNFRRVAPIIYPFFLINPDFDIAHAHNQWLQVALDLGLPGLVAYLMVWFLAVVMLWQVINAAGEPFLRMLGAGLLASLVGYFVYGLTDTVALGAKPGVLWWLLLGLSVAAYIQTRSQPTV